MVVVINKHLDKAGSGPSQTVGSLLFTLQYTQKSSQLQARVRLLFIYVCCCFSAATYSSSPGLGQGDGSGQLFAVSVVEVELDCGAGRLGSPSSGGSGEMARALLSSSMALTEGSGGAKEWAWITERRMLLTPKTFITDCIGPVNHLLLAFYLSNKSTHLIRNALNQHESSRLLNHCQEEQASFMEHNSKAYFYWILFKLSKLMLGKQ